MLANYDSKDKLTSHSVMTTVLKTLTLNVYRNFFSLVTAQARNYQYKKVCVFDRNPVVQRKPAFCHDLHRKYLVAR